MKKSNYLMGIIAASALFACSEVELTDIREKTEENVKEIFADIRANGYLLDCIVFNAANLGIGQVSMDVDMQEFMGVFNTNIGWNFMMARAAAEQMKEKHKGSIVFIGSNSAIRVTMNRCAYCSSKAAMIANVTIKECLILNAWVNLPPP